MSTPSPNDGNSSEEFYRGGINPNIPQPPQIQQYVSSLGIAQSAPSAGHPVAAGQHQTQPPPPPQFVHWTNPLIGGTPFMQQHHPHPPQQLFNDVLYNLQAQAAYAASVPPTPAPQQETYSVLRVGNGNFLKIYHCPETAMGPLPGETSFAPIHHGPPPPPPPFNPQTQQQQAAAYHHIQQQQQQQPANVQPAIQQQQQQQHTPSHIAPANANSVNSAPQIFNSYELFSSNTFTQLPTAEMPPVLLLGTSSNNINRNDQQQQQQPIALTEEFVEAVELQNPTQPMMKVHSNNNNTVITNCLDNQPTTTPLLQYEQFENTQTMTMVENNEYQAQQIEQREQQEQSHNNHINTITNELSDKMPIDAANFVAIQPQQQHVTQINAPTQVQSKDKHHPIIITQSPLKHHKSEIPRQEAPKKRIVAEVKPMRMTYSDVLSKINNQHQTQQNASNYVANNHNNSSNNSLNGTIRNQQQKASAKSSSPSDNSNAGTFLSARRNLEEFAAGNRPAKKSPTHDNKENSQQQQQPNKNNNNKRSSLNGGTTMAGNNSNGNLKNSTIPSANTSGQKNSINNLKASGKNGNDATHGSSKGNTTTNNNNNGNNATASTNVYATTNNTYVRKSSKSTNSSSSYSGAGGGTSGNGGQQRSRYQNNSNASYSYSSTKRNRNNLSYGTSSSPPSYGGGSGNSANNRNYELAKRFLKAWYTFTLKILTWLFNLVYDIVVVGCSVLYDRLTSGYEYCKIYGWQLWKDLKQNSNKPSIWFRNACRRFDTRFAKTSKWAFWRRFYKKRPPDITSEATKTGRLPQTGEEAMYQLLNCKGKDAYSILGVPRNSSQEQIRKHYKKIAVLVHPDKNKQPGAEEAFKVLQRAFELIAEPENRLSYDQSLAEALHAEKAWTELHDLLSQLQTKITEAANTIRCSTCGLRHPRKITDRPHYAARECASCKIRHSAREGDIWAETSMLGLRWKYLALMEGKVYDITEWANCQKGALAHLEPNSHMVQYRIVRGAQQQQHQQQQQKQSHHQQQQPSQHHQQHAGSHYAGGGPAGGKFKRDNIPTTEASLHEFLDNLYSGQNPQQQNSSAFAGSGRRRNRR
ncbi:transcription factor mef2A [Musca vetustissima]|uniref:transcription factor mef2A n=1 Tax=Musca vetustissima TaxID=27455 RepID=UPI002AB63A09|nr:transcription factor mef2A [Musca vetustissima]